MTASSLDFIHVVIYVSVTKIIKNTAAHAILPQISNILHGQHIYVSETRHVIMEHWNFTFNPASWHKVKTYEILVCACKDSKLWRACMVAMATHLPAHNTQLGTRLLLQTVTSEAPWTWISHAHAAVPTSYTYSSSTVYTVRMKTDRMWSDVIDITYAFIFLSGFGFEYG